MLLHLVLTSVRSRESEGSRGIAMRSDSKVRSARPDVSTDDKLDRLSRDEDRKRRTGTLYRTNAYVHLVYAYMRPTMVNGSEILLESGTMAREEEVKAFFSIPGHRRRGRNRSKRMIVFLHLDAFPFLVRRVFTSRTMVTLERRIFPFRRISFVKLSRIRDRPHSPPLENALLRILIKL